MKWPFLIFLFMPQVAFTQVGIQTNLLGYLVMPLIDENYQSYELGVETKLASRIVLKSSVYYFKRTDFNKYNAVINRADELRKFGFREASKFYPKKSVSKHSMPEGFYVGAYADIMYGKRTFYEVKNGSKKWLQTNEGVYLSLGCNLGYTFVTDHFTVEPNLGIGASYVSPQLLIQSEWLNFDPEIQSLSTCHLQLNIGYRF